jgi:hypothetical protein
VVLLARLGQYFREALNHSEGVALRDFLALFMPLWLQCKKSLRLNPTIPEVDPSTHPKTTLA